MSSAPNSRAASPICSAGYSDRLKLKIERLIHRGLGLARDQGKTIFIPGVIPGEIVLADLEQDKPAYASARLRKACKTHQRLATSTTAAAVVVACARAVRAGNPPVEAVVNLGVIRFGQGRDEEARSLWQEALRRDPLNVIARLNLERLETSGADRAVDMRYLAREVLGRDPPTSPTASPRSAWASAPGRCTRSG